MKDYLVNKVGDPEWLDSYLFIMWYILLEGLLTFILESRISLTLQTSASLFSPLPFESTRAKLSRASNTLFVIWFIL